ncbi:Tat pathway signal protein [Clostridium sp. chh4-2]|uniref:tripartite tricarboxylate transporter permease n=1 Tax=Clostridium sp. chh4-2 TaxID=2067550 RepID=UPI000CCDCE69|nr:tripartite tricarboxylate transporter permease [Clostridium sp. chh4-2]PNV59006.1 Tat pathway signal protein [Clostridium sp. chh4-2]
MVWSAFSEALQQILTPTGLLYIIGGGVLGMILGAIPGLSGGTASVIILPLTYKMEPGLALALLASLYIGSTSGGCIGAILLGIPGTGASIPTAWEGYPMARRGEGVRALSIAVTCNFIGTLPGLIIAMIACIPLSTIACKMGPWEYFSLLLLAITMVVALSKDNLMKGFVSVALALIISCVGSSPIDGAKRFTFGSTYLLGGVSMIVAMLGIIAGRMIIEEYAFNKEVDTSIAGKVSRYKFPAADLLANVGNIIRSFLVGVFTGFLPALGGGVASMICYATEKNRSKHPETFGNGEPAGIIACETTNNAVIGGALIPMISMGIPGSPALIYMITALSIHGISCGPTLLRDYPDVVYLLYLSCIFAAVAVLFAQVFGMPLFPMLLKVPSHFLYPAIIAVAFLGAFISQGNLSGVVICLCFCLLGMAMRYFEIPDAPFMLTYCLAASMETKLRQGLVNGFHGIWDFFTRPISCLFIILAVISLLYNLFGDKIKAKLVKSKTV